MFKIISLLSLFAYAFSQPAKGDLLPLVGGSHDDDGCLIGAGYDWCESSQSCIRQWVTPCKDNYDGCDDCFDKQRKGMNIACPIECDFAIGPMPPVPVPMPPVPTDHPTDHPIDPVIEPVIDLRNPFCSDMMCMMYCENGFQQDQNGCNTCTCNDIIILHPVDPLVNQPMDPLGECPIPYTDCNNNYVCPRVTEITHCSYDGISGYTTYQLSLVITNPLVQNIYAIYGDNQYGEHPLSVPPAYQGQNIYNSNLGGIAPEIIAINQDAIYDSWLTIGLTNGDPDNKLSTVGIDFKSWDLNNGIYTTNGAIFVMDSEEIIIPGSEYVVAQLTIPDNQIEDVLINVQGQLLCDNCDHSHSWKEMQVLFHLEKPQIVDTNVIPHNCISWHDGCNTCSVNNGVIGGCTRRMCFREEAPHCLSFASGH
jgi:hypothetical protein